MRSGKLFCNKWTKYFQTCFEIATPVFGVNDRKLKTFRNFSPNLDNWRYRFKIQTFNGRKNVYISNIEARHFEIFFFKIQTEVFCYKINDTKTQSSHSYLGQDWSSGHRRSSAWAERGHWGAGGGLGGYPDWSGRKETAPQSCRNQQQMTPRSG